MTLGEMDEGLNGESCESGLMVESRGFFESGWSRLVLKAPFTLDGFRVRGYALRRLAVYQPEVLMYAEAADAVMALADGCGEV